MLRAKFLMIFLLVQFSFRAYAEEISPIEVTDQNIKVGSGNVQELYFGFEKGDQIVLNLKVAKGKTLKEIRVEDIDGNPKFSDFKVSNVKNKTIRVGKKGVFKFSFTNTSIGSRICKIHIQRIPANENTVDFNTNVVWKTIYDTTYIPYKVDSLIGYDTTYYYETIKELKKTYKAEDLVLEKSQKVHSYWNSNSSYTYLRVDLPANKKEEFREEKTIAWAYWIGVGDESRVAYQQNLKAVSKLASGLASTFVSPLAALAVGAVSELITPKSGDDVSYSFMNDYTQVQYFLNGSTHLQWNNGKGNTAYGKFDKGLNQTFYVGLHNDNSTRGIEVDIKIVVIREVKEYENVTYKKYNLKGKYVSLNKVKMDIATNEIRVCAE